MLNCKTALLVVFFAALLGGHDAVRANVDTFSIGDARIKIPTPPGYQRVTPDMEELYELTNLFALTVNEVVATYYKEEKLLLWEGGDTSDANKWFGVQINKQMKNELLSIEDFDQIKQSIKKSFRDIAELVDNVETRNEIEKINDNITEYSEKDLNFELSSAMSLDTHYETDHAMANSVLMNASHSGDKKITVATSTAINVAGKVLYLHAYGQLNDLEWTRQASQDWAKSILAINPPPPVKNSNKASVGIFSGSGRSAAKGLLAGAILASIFCIFEVVRRSIRRAKGGKLR